MKLGELIAVDKQYDDSTIELRDKGSAEVSNNKNKISRTIDSARFTISVGLLGAVVGFLAFNYDFSEVLSDLHQLSFLTIGVVFTALLANALAATLRFKIIAADLGHLITFRKAMATVSASNLAGALFFQIAGQLIARSVIMGRAGVPFANVVVLTAYERILSAVISALLGLAGAYYIFGVVYLDQNTGGIELIKIAIGLIAATTLGALLGYGRMAARSIAPLLTRQFVRRSLRVIGLTLLVQMPMMIAYVTVSKALSAYTPIPNLIAASTIVMFAASVPISLAGWGVREMSAVAALGAIGVAGHAAFTAAVLIGTGSLLALGVVAALSLFRLPASVDAPREVTAPATQTIDFSRALSWFFPLAAATLVLFQIYIPVGSGLLNVNLADPIATIGGSFFVLNAIKNREMPRWRASYVNTAIAIMTLALTISLLIGGWRFGWTTWAIVNRFLGWFVVIAYAATGALIVREGREEGLRVLLLTFAGATAAVSGVEIMLVILRSLGLQPSAGPGYLEGFAQNRNAFAFQILMAMSTAIVCVRGTTLRILLSTLMISTLWYAGSRSGWIAAICITAAGLYVYVTTAREVMVVIICATSTILATVALSTLTELQGTALVAVVPEASSTHERLLTIIGGLNLFFAHPVSGAGLGAFRHETILGLDGNPLIIHSTAVWLLAELGIAGFLAFVIPALSVFVTEWRSARNDRTSALVALSFVAFAVMSGPADMLYQRTFWLVVGAALAFTPTIPDEDPAHGVRRHISA